MVKLIIGAKGKGKTKYLLEHANTESKNSDGLVIYLDKNAKHMFELDRNIRYINVMEYPISDVDSLMGFICGLISGNNDIESIYFDSFLTLSSIEELDCTEAIDKLIIIADKLKVDCIVSLSIDEKDLNPKFKNYIELSL